MVALPINLNLFVDDNKQNNSIVIRPEILLHPNIPKPLHGLAPRSILGVTWWDNERQKAYAKNNYCCWACGVHKFDAKYKQWLEAHECYEFNYMNGSAKMIEVTALCHACHNYIHNGRLIMLFRAGKITEEHYCEIRERGLELLKSINNENNPYIVDDFTDDVVDWDKWHLIIEGKKYYSKFKNYAEWSNFYKFK